MSVCVCVCVWGGGGGGGVGVVGWGGGSEFSDSWGKRGEGGGKDGREFSFLTAWWMKLSFSLFVCLS